MTEIDLDKEPPVLVYSDDIILTYSFNITLYSLNMSTPQQKEAVIAIFDDYAALYGSRMNWSTNPVSGKFKHIRGKVNSYLLPDEWLMGEPEKNGYEFLFHGGKKQQDASDVSFKVLAEDLRSARGYNLSYLSCRFPLADVRSGKLNLPELMQRWCALLKPWHGRGGYSAGWWYNKYCREQFIYARLTDQLMFYPGLQFDGDNLEHIFDQVYETSLYDGPRCADWLIALSDPFLEKLGGLEAVTDAMRPCPVLPYEGGAVLQAGDAPGLGKDGDPASLPDYLHLGRVIEPVRAKNLHNIICVSTTSQYECSQELTDKWCTRFSGGK